MHLSGSGSVAPCGPDGGFRIGLKRRAEFQRAAKGLRFNANALCLQALRRADDVPAPSRFGLTVTKRVGNAVERNRIKRRFRAVLRGAGVSVQPGYDYVIVARREALTIPFASLVADVAKTLDRSRSGRSSGRRGKSAGRAMTLDPSA